MKCSFVKKKKTIESGKLFLSLQEIMMYNEETYGLKKKNSEKNFKDIMVNFQLKFGLYSFLVFMLCNA